MSKKFSFDTVSNFDEHIAQSIPNYDLLFDLVVNVAPFFLRKGKSFVDLGCSTGALLEAVEHDGPKVGVDVSSNLLPADSKDVVFEKRDLVDYEPPNNSCLVTSIFTFQFLDQGARKTLMQRVFDSLEPGGAFVWAEKVTSESGFWEQVQTFSYYDFKLKSFNAVDILSKEKSLRAIMRPWTSKQNQALARNVGFVDGELVWKFHNFECWVFVKSGA